MKIGRIVVFFMVLAAIIFGIFSVLNSKSFEANPPSILSDSEIFWSLKKPYEVSISDESGIKLVKIWATDGTNQVPIMQEIFEVPKNEFSAQITYPKTGFFDNKRNFSIIIEAKDGSKANFFEGNTIQKEIKINIDGRKPQITILSNSYGIYKGGVGAVIFKVSDEYLKDVYLITNNGKKFIPTKFFKDDTYICLVAWPTQQETFSADIYALDKAGNDISLKIPYYLKPKKYRDSNIELKDNFLSGKIVELASQISDASSSMESLERFKFINETVRESNEKTIESVTSAVPLNFEKDFKIKPFYPLKNGAAVAAYGDKRTYTKNGQKVSFSYHLGYDLASTAFADIVATNGGKVVFADFNGIYGNTIIIDHGLGLYSLYSHCSSFLAQKGDVVNDGQVIAKSGMTGLALGDHLHFGVVVQGVEVNPTEWIDKDWMKLNITDIIEQAKKSI